MSNDIYGLENEVVKTNENKGALIVTTVMINQNNIASAQMHLELSKFSGVPTDE